MQRKRNMIAAVLLLCAVRALGSDGVEPQACVPSPEVACFLPADYLNKSGPVRMDLSMGMKLVISLKGLPGHPPCRWNGTTDHQEMTINGGYTVVKSALSEKDSGEYTLTCETNNSSQITVHLNVLKRPTTPRLILDGVNQKFRSPRFQCTSEGSPRPIIQWLGGKAGEDVSEINGTAKSSISSADYFDNEVMCCATNTEGQECAQLYDYDFDGSKDEVSNVTLSPGQTLLLRCQRRGVSSYPVWEKGDKRLEARTVGCDLKKKMCITDDKYYGRLFAYLLMTSLSVDDSGTYTCRSPNGPTKSVYIHVQAEGFLSVQLDESKTVSAKNASSAGLQASVSYHPLLTHCSWEAPDKTITKCTRDTWVTKHRNVMLRRPLVSGVYKLHLEAGGYKATKTISVCVEERPTTPRLMLDGVNQRYRSPRFQCTSKGSPGPIIQWSGGKAGEDVSEINGTAKSSISSADYPKNEVMCCATNNEGQECSQLYDYDFDGSKDEVSNVTLSPGQTLLLRCQNRGSSNYPVWEKGDKRLEARTVGCDLKKKMCITNDKHAGRKFAYLLMTSLSVDDSGTYTCRSSNGQTKSVYIHVQAEGFLSVQLDETKIVSAENASSAGLQASVSYHPLLTHCSWEAPDKTITKCTRDTWVTKHRNVTLRRPLMSGAYKLHLEAGGYNTTKTISVCVVGEPVFTFAVHGDNVIVQTASLVPANYSWIEDITDDGGNTSYETIHHETENGVQECNKKISTTVPKEKVMGRHVKFCLENSVILWCRPYHSVLLPQPSTSYVPQNDPALMLLKVLSLALLLALVVISVVLTYFVKKKKPQYQPQLQMIQMVGPNDNDYIYINFKDFEYDRKWEFPRENLELGKELGSGAFGMVVEATAYGINKPGVSQQVAVKMLKEKHHSVEKEALMSELKMLTHIGHHNNIVNLLGACTDSGPIYLIFQYCYYGDLLNYLKNNSERYHKSVTDAFNKDRFVSLYHNLSLGKNQSELEARMDTYVPMFSSTSRGQEDIALLTFNSTDMDAYEDPSMIYESADDEGEDLQALTFDDLLSFAFQVAKGMEFLSSKHCIHRDLAARNVLVTKGRLVKIGDFGLARDIDNDSNYVVRGNVRLPVKWMAPESIFQGLYTMKSDVWAYGILLWEIFSLGVTPYPGMKVDHTFYSMIERGFMMDCPYYADESVYGIMCKCWALDPCNRPSFSKLVSFMCDQLTNREEMLYYNMLDQYSTEYQNALTILDIAASTKHNDNKTQLGNDYCKTNATEESKAEESDSVTVAAEEEEREEEEKKEEEDLKPFDTE